MARFEFPSNIFLCLQKYSHVSTYSHMDLLFFINILTTLKEKKNVGKQKKEMEVLRTSESEIERERDGEIERERKQ